MKDNLTEKLVGQVESMQKNVEKLLDPESHVDKAAVEAQIKEAVDGVNAEIVKMNSAIEALNMSHVKPKEKENFKLGSVFKAAAIMNKSHVSEKAAWDQVNDGASKELMDEFQAKASQSVGTDADGGYTVPTTLMPELQRLVRQESILGKIGVRMPDIGQGVGNITYPRQDGVITAAWAAELATLQEQIMKFGEVALAPKKLYTFTPTSNELLYDSAIDITSEITADASKSIRKKLEEAVFVGDGTGNSPIGVLNTPGIGAGTSVSSAPVNPDWDVFKKLMEVVDNAGNLDASGANAFVGPNILINALYRQTVLQYSGQANDKGMPVMISPEMITALTGAPQFKSDVIPVNGDVADTYPLLFGDWSQVKVPMWGGLKIDVSTDFKFGTDQTVFRLILRTDVGVMQPNTFAAESYVRAERV